VPLLLAFSVSPAAAIEFNPVYDSSVLEHGVIYVKYIEPETTSMIVGFPKRIQAKSSCVDLVFYLAPIDFTYKESPASIYWKRYAAFTLDVWTSDGLKVGSVDSRKDASFFSPTVITKVPLKVCDSSINSGNDIVLRMDFRAGVGAQYEYNIRRFSENLTLISTPIATTTTTTIIKKTTITCVKGKLTKKVTAVKPKCPTGYKVKK
jgi:hypothetical protein